MCQTSIAKHEEKAKELYCRGCNCAQAVFAAFSEDLGLSQDTAGKIALSFGGGMGSGETCGALTGAFMALGLSQTPSFPPLPGEKSACLAEVKQLTNAFQEAFGTTLCREILASPEGKGKQLCPVLVGFMAAQTEALLQNRNK